MATAAVTNTFVAGTTAVAAEVNTNFQDLVDFLNNSVVHRDGSKSMTGALAMGGNNISSAGIITAANGAQTTPSFSFASDPNNGMYLVGTDEIGLVTAGSARLRITSDGRVAIGAGPLAGYHLYVVAANAVTPLRVYHPGTGTTFPLVEAYSDVTSSNTVKWRVEGDGDNFNVNGTYGAISDRRLKRAESIKDARNYLPDLTKLKVRKYQMLDSDDELLGFIADEVAEVFPGLVKIGEDGFASIKTTVLIPMLLSAVQELSARVAELEAKVG